MTPATAPTLEVVVRRAAPTDAESVMEMVREIAAHEGQSEHVTVTSARWADVLARPDVIVLLASRDGRDLGYVSAIRRLHLWSDRDVIALDDLYVREEARNAGVGRALMATLASRHAEPDRLKITWGVEPDNLAAQRFYQRLGAGLRHKVVAGWDPTGYADVVRSGAAQGH
ncbi:MAG: GNAT family N-acetyltransferase [Intrasporangium sp.]|uniref:GNAT family N-acetyltransferase n=1 Tax=Intrasporangium sp. TaxID=1925024 RepID=UPI003F7F87B7